ISTRTIPNLFMYIAAIFDKRLSFSFIRGSINRKDQFSNERLKNDLGINPRSVKESLIDTAKSLYELGIVKPL
ncbi:MAG: hypothetical protein KAJ62_14980, partial [Desulfobacteraceae bacterium]|nr:hypothetical protein [Desulfobacteraceae bacterium]